MSFIKFSQEGQVSQEIPGLCYLEPPHMQTLQGGDALVFLLDSIHSFLIFDNFVTYQQFNSNTNKLQHLA